MERYNIMVYNFNELYPDINCENLNEHDKIDILTYNSLIISEKAINDKNIFRKKI